MNKHIEYVGLLPRILATFLDVFIYYAFLAFIYFSYKNKYEFYSLYDADDPTLWLLIYCGLLVFIICDQVLAPVIFGRTFSRWICGYKILNKLGRYPTLWQSIKRYLSIIFFELFFLGLITFFTSIIRKDKAAIHDLIAGTNAVFPDKPQGLKKTRVSIALLVFMLSMMYLFVNITYLIYEVYIEPTENEAFNYMYPKVIYREKNKSTDFININGIDLFLEKEVYNYSICSKSSKIIDLSINGKKFTVASQKFQTNIPIFGNMYLFNETGDYAVFFIKTIRILNYYPFHEKINLMAEKVVNYSMPQFLLFSPLDNFAYILSKLSYVILFQDIKNLEKNNVELYSIIGDDYYMHTNLYHNKEVVGVDIVIFQDNEIIEINIWSNVKDSTQESYKIVKMLHSNLSPSLIQKDIIKKCISN